MEGHQCVLKFPRKKYRLIKRTTISYYSLQISIRPKEYISIYKVEENIPKIVVPLQE